MNPKKDIPSFKLIGLALPHKTTNEGGQSGIDCGNLWQKFETKNYAQKVAGKLSDELYAVYFDYEGGHTQPFAYFIGCPVTPGTPVPDGMQTLTIPSGTYHKVTARGKMPQCMADQWQQIWSSDIPRSYQFDFEIYDERSQNWNDVEVDIYLSMS